MADWHSLLNYTQLKEQGQRCSKEEEDIRRSVAPPLIILGNLLTFPPQNQRSTELQGTEEEVVVVHQVRYGIVESWSFWYAWGIDGVQRIQDSIIWTIFLSNTLLLAGCDKA